MEEKIMAYCKVNCVYGPCFQGDEYANFDCVDAQWELTEEWKKKIKKEEDKMRHQLGCRR